MNVYKTLLLVVCTKQLELVKSSRAFSLPFGGLNQSNRFATKAGQQRRMGYFDNVVAVCQFTARNDKIENFNTCKDLIEKAVSAGAKMVFLPEACDYIGESKEEVLSMSEPLDGPLVNRYKELARESKVWLSLGGIHERVDAEKVRNTHLVISDSGDIVAVYRKLHLFDVEIPDKGIRLKESDYVIKGQELVNPIISPVGKIGLGICYDLRFPEMSLTLTKLGANILTYPSAFTFATGAVHWEVLLRSRAIENQCYVIAAAQYGSHNKKRSSWGHAMIIDPSGNIVAQCAEGTRFVLANIDHSLIESIRKSMPVSEHRRTDIYPPMLPLDRKSSSADVVKSVQLEQNYSSDAPLKQYQFGQVTIPETCIFFKTDKTMAFVNKRCVVPGHVLIAPLRPALRLKDLEQGEVQDLFLVVQQVEKVMEDVHGATSTTVTLQDGPEAGRTIQHLHVHILPRKVGDFLQNDQIYYELQRHDKDESKPWRSEKEMCAEAMMLRKRFPPLTNKSE